MSTTNWHLPSTTTRIKPCTAAADDFQHLLKEVQDGEQKWGILWAKTRRMGLQISRYFQEPILWGRFFYLFMPRKAPTFLIVMTTSCDWHKPSAKDMCLIACTPVFTKITYVLIFPPYSLELETSNTWDNPFRE